MNKLKKFVALFLVLSMLPITAMAEENNGNNNVLLTDAQVKQAPDYNSTDYQNSILNSIESSNNYVENKNLLRTGSQKFLSVSKSKQETTFYCGPAVAQMILRYKGKSYSQSTLASDNYCGTDNDGETFV